MNSYREALSRPIGGVGNPSPGNSCQRPRELIGCVWTDLAKLTGTLLRRCESTPAASTLLHRILRFFNLLFIYFDTLLLFLRSAIQSSIFFLKHQSPFFFPNSIPSCLYLHAPFGAPHPCFTLVNLRQWEKTGKINRSRLDMATQGQGLTVTAAGGATLRNHQDQGPAWSESLKWGLGMRLVGVWFSSNKLLAGHAEPLPPAPWHMLVLKQNSRGTINNSLANVVHH